MPLPEDGDGDGFVTINVGGLKFQTRRSTLKRFPNTLLGSPEIEEFYVPELQEYFFDRSRSAFEQIMYYYQSAGIMCLPASVNPDIFVEELKFFKMDERVVKRFNAVGHITQGGAEIPEDVFTFPIQKKIWLLLDEPNSSLPAKLIGYLDQIVIILAVIAQCAESLPNIRLATDDSKDLIGSISVGWMKELLGWMEVCSIAWFTVVYVLRLFSCPSKFDFAKSPLNWLDILAILPFYMDLVLKNTKPYLTILRFFRTIRIVRIFKISRYFQGLFALGRAVSASAGELLLLCLMLATFVVLFSSLVYFTDSCATKEECEANKDDNQFDSVIAGFWWSIVTMSTVGYGDYVPKTPLGKVVGSLCALTGILVISLPFPLIITNFNKFMRYRIRKSKVYATIEDGWGDELPYHIPEYSGVAYGFLDEQNLVKKPSRWKSYKKVVNVVKSGKFTSASPRLRQLNNRSQISEQTAV